MAQLDDLKQCVSDLQDDVTRMQDDIGKVIGMLQQSTPDVQAAIDALKAVDTNLDTAAQSMEDAMNVAPAPTPPTP